MSVTVLYHYPCPDGAFAALAAHLYHSALGIPVTFIPNPVYAPKRVEDLDVAHASAVYLLDFAGPQGFAEALAQKAPSVVVLDHHKSAAEALPAAGQGPPALHCLLDMHRSGATLAYDFFSLSLGEHRRGAGAALGEPPPAVLAGFPLPGVPTTTRLGPGLVAGPEQARVEELFALIEDADLWRWALPDSRAFSSGLKDLDLEMDLAKNGRLFEQLAALSPPALIEGGRRSLAEKQRLMDAALGTARPVRLGNGRFGACLGVRADEIAHLRSELGHQLAERSQRSGLRAMGAVAYIEAAMGDPSRIKVSLRSVGAEDTTEISQAYGGGGHRNASSFILPLEEFERWNAPQ